MEKKIMICCNVYPPNFIGGAELIAHNQAKQLQSQGYNVIIFTGNIRGHGKRHSLQREDYEGLPVYRVHLTSEDYDQKFVNFSHKDVEEHFKNILKKFSPDIVHFHNLIGLSVGLIHVAKQQGIKTVLTLHDHWGFCFKNTIIKNNDEICRDFTQCTECMRVIPDENYRNIPMRIRQDFMAMQLEDIDAFISPSQYLADAYVRAGIPHEKMHIVGYGIDVHRFSQISKKPRAHGRIRFTFVGHMGMHKGIHVLLDALQFIDDIQNVTINLVGDGEFLEKYTEFVQEKGLDDIVKFWGKIENTNHIYSQTDVFILPSIWPENQPVTITEAMASKIPVIASNIGGIPELVDDKKTGFLFEPGNAKDLANKMLVFIQEPKLIDTFGENAYDKIKNNTYQRRISEIEKIYTGSIKSEVNRKTNFFLIACYGNRFDPKCTRAFDLFSKQFWNTDCKFVLYDSLQDDQYKSIKVFWVIDPTLNEETIKKIQKNKIVILVPENNEPLKNLCISGNCGLFYQNSIEIVACLDFFLKVENDNKCKIMGENGFKLFLQSHR
jgi:glycosyltransferase involved in cell wall biosynthesis